MLPEEISVKKRQISSFLTKDIADYIFKLDMPGVLSLPFNPKFKDNKDVITIAQNYVWPAKKELNKVVNDFIANQFITQLFYAKTGKSFRIRSKGSQAKFVSKHILSKQLLEGVASAEKQMVSSGIIKKEEQLMKYFNELKGHFNPSARKSDKIPWINEATPVTATITKNGVTGETELVKGIYEVFLDMTVLSSRAISDLLYLQNKGKSDPSAKSKSARVFHKSGYMTRSFGKAYKEAREKLLDFNGIMAVGESEPYGSTSLLNFIANNISNVPGIKIDSFINLYDPNVRKKEGKKIKCHHYKISPVTNFIYDNLELDKLSDEAKLVLAYSRVDLSRPISFHVKSISQEINDTFGPIAHNIYKNSTRLEQYRASLDKKGLDDLDEVEGRLSLFFPESLESKVHVPDDYTLLTLL